MNVYVKKGRAVGIAAAPPSKSYAHRMMICAALAEGESTVRGLSKSRDMLATMDCIRALGAECSLEGDILHIRGCRPDFKEGREFPCYESGSTLRFFIPIASVCGEEAVFTGKPRLIERGVSVYEKLYGEKGLFLRKNEDSITVRGRLAGGEFSVAGNISSQFISGLLFALPLLEKDSTVNIIPPIESRPYIDITIDAIKNFGVSIEEADPGSFFIKGGQSYKAADTAVEGDWSNGAALLALNTAGGSVKVTGLNEKSIQGDRICVEYLRRLEEADPRIDLSDCPDLGPVLFAAAAMKNGAVFTGTRRLRIKESDRAAAMAAELAKFGIRCDVSDNSVTVHKGSLQTPQEVLCGHNDHRIVMAMTLLCLKTGGEISDAEAITKSFPDFFDVIRGLGPEVINGIE